MCKQSKYNSLMGVMTHFADEKTCLEHLENLRWPNGQPECPHCEHDVVYRFSDGKRFKCANCRKQFTAKVGTIFESSNLPLRKWFAAIYLATSHKKGISSLQLHRDLGVTQKTAWFMLGRLRNSFKTKSNIKFTGTTQADETFIGGKNKNRHANKKVEDSQGRSVKDKTPVFGLVNNGAVSTAVVSDTKAKTLKPIIEAMVEKGSIVVTDEWSAYNGLSGKYRHEVIKHRDGQYINGAFHTNSVEGFWSLLKRGIYGIYHSASAKHLNKYCDEFSYRYNTRTASDGNRFVSSLANANERLTYKELIG